MIPERVMAWLSLSSLRWWAAGAVAVLSAPSLFLGLQGDDVLFLSHVKSGARATDLFAIRTESAAGIAGLRASGDLPWWAPDETQLHFFRPITSLTHYVDFSLWPDLPWLMRAQNLLWYGLLILSAEALYRRMSDRRWVAGLALWLFAIDDPHAVPIGWITARNTVMGAAVGSAALLAHLRWRMESWPAGRYLGPGLLLAALLCSEGSLAFGGYLVAFAIVLDSGPLHRRLLALWPYVAVVVAWRVGYVLGGYGARGLSIYLDPSEDPARFAVSALQTSLILAATQFTLPVALPTLAFKGTASLYALGVVAAVAIALAPTLERDARARFWACGLLLAGLPFGATQPADRLLMPIGLGAFALLARFLSDLSEGRVGGRLRSVVGFLMLGLHALLAPILFVPHLYFAEFVQRGIDALDAAIPHRAGIEHEEVVIVQRPEVITSLFLRAQRQVRGEPFPSAVLTLYAGLSSIDVERVDRDTLEIRPRAGFLPDAFESMFRSERLAFSPGERIEVGPMIVEVQTVTRAGKPLKVAFRFDGGLMRANRHWMIWKGGRAVPWTPPAVGEVVRLPAVSPF